MQCPICGSAELISDIKNIEYTYKGHSTVLENISGDFCQACDEIIMDQQQGDHYIQQINFFQQNINIPFHD